MNYVLDLENSWIGYVTQTQKKYFKYALDYVVKNNTEGVRVNKTYYYFDFDNNEVKIGSNNRLTTYKIKKIEGKEK